MQRSVNFSGKSIFLLKIFAESAKPEAIDMLNAAELKATPFGTRISVGIYFDDIPMMVDAKRIPHVRWS